MWIIKLPFVFEDAQNADRIAIGNCKRATGSLPMKYLRTTDEGEPDNEDKRKVNIREKIDFFVCECLGFYMNVRTFLYFNMCNYVGFSQYTGQASGSLLRNPVSSKLST